MKAKQKLKMRILVDRWRPTTAIMFVITKMLQFMAKLGFTAKEDGWRRTARAYCRTEQSKFSLVAFGLNCWSDMQEKKDRDLSNSKEHLIERLASFLREYHSAHWQIKWSRFSARRDKADFIDIVYSEFDKQGNLMYIRPYLDSSGLDKEYIDVDLINKVNYEIIQIYNETKGKKDKIRPMILKKKLDRWVSAQSLQSRDAEKSIGRLIKRILSSTFIHFEQISSSHSVVVSERMSLPDFNQCKHPGFGLFNIRCRFIGNCETVDLWFQINHIPVDAVPMQEMLSDLGKQWGKSNDISFARSEQSKPESPKLCSTTKGKDGIYHVSQFIDFQNFFKARNELNEQYNNQMDHDITIASMFAWGLAHHSIFDGIKFAIPVHLIATSHQETTLGFIYIRPSLYFDKNSLMHGFLRFQQDFNRQLQDAKRRSGERYEAVQFYALTPPIIYTITNKLIHSGLAGIFGTVGITIVRDAELFIAPISDNIRGFIALGNLLTKTSDDRIGGFVSIKAPKDEIEYYLESVSKVSEDFHKYI